MTSAHNRDGRAMITHLFPSFLTDKAEYERAEQFWQTLCSGIISQDAVVKDWRPWLNTCFADGTPFGEGNPICNLMSPSTRKGLFIVQRAPTSDDVEITAFVDSFGDEGDEDYVIQLVIDCELSHESAEIAHRLITEWMKTRDVPKEFDSVITSWIRYTPRR